jgi:two-component system phosphate regulon response regulator PhoB
MSAKQILIVEDEVAIRDMVKMVLSNAGFDCQEAGSVQEAHVAIVDEAPDLILLDWMLPGNSGIELVRRLRREEVTKSIPVIMLTACTTEDNKIQGLDVGADDYITKPFSPKELVARIKALLRRTSSNDEDVALKVGGVELNPQSHRVFIDGEPVNLGPTEFKLLKFFMTHQDRAYSRAQILDHVWGGNVYIEERTVDVHIRRLRKAMQLGPGGVNYGDLIQTVRGAGYRFSTVPVSK